MRLLSLPGILRAAGLPVSEYPGWRTRGSAGWGPVRGIIVHHTGGRRESSDAGELRTLAHGRPGLDGPISQVYVSRTGAWTVVASGESHHARIGWGGPAAGLGNANLVGIEAQHAAGEPWTTRQYGSLVTGTAALCRALQVPPALVAGHKEHQPGEKVDPGFGMDAFRRAVAAALSDEGEDLPMDQRQFNDLFANALDDPEVLIKLRRIPWQYTGGGIPKGRSTLAVLDTIREGVADLLARGGGYRADS